MSDAAATANEELVRRAFERFSARDADGLIELMDPAGEVFPYAIDERRHDGYRGHDGLRQYIADVGQMFEEFSVRIDEIRDIGDGVVLAEGRIQGRARDGSDIDMAAAWLWTVSDGLVTRMQAHPASKG
jgi:ketosteroid isomerase-like protein